MADSSVPVTPGTGADVDTRTTSTGEHRQVMAVGNDGDYVAGVHPLNGLDVQPPDTTLFYDAFASLDTVDRWTVTGTAPTVTNSILQFPATASVGGSLTSKPVFSTFSSQYNVANFAMIHEAPFSTGAYRFWGFGQASGSPSSTGAVALGVGFEIDASSNNLLSAVTYSGSSRTIHASWAKKDDSAIHRYTVMYRQSRIYWYIDNQEVHVATTTWPVLTTTELPLLITQYNSGGPTGSPFMSFYSVGVGDSNRLATQLSDGALPFRKARINKDGELKVGSGRNTTFDGFAATWRLVGTAANPINLLSIENTTGSGVLVAVRRITVDISVSATTAYLLQSYIRLWRSTTVPTGGTQLTKWTSDTTDTSAANVILRGPSSADGTASAITYAVPAGTPMRSQAVPALVTGVGQWVTDDLDMWVLELPPLVLRAGESLLIASHGANSAATYHFTTKVHWEEYTS